MADFSAKQIANEFLRRRHSSALPAQMQLQKLIYIANGWNLVLNDMPLVEESPRAWDNGPVYKSLWDHIRDYGYENGADGRILVDPVTKAAYSAELTPRERLVIDHVWKKYGGYSGVELSRMTHEPGTPWFRAYFERGRNSPLLNSEIKSHYIDLAMAGREQGRQQQA